MIQTLLLLKNRKVFDEKDQDHQTWRRILLLSIGGLITVGLLSVLLAKGYIHKFVDGFFAIYGILFWDAFARFPKDFDTFTGRIIEGATLAFLELVALIFSFGIVEFAARIG